MRCRDGDNEVDRVGIMRWRVIDVEGMGTMRWRGWGDNEVEGWGQ